MEAGYALFYDDHGNALQRAVDNNLHGYSFKQVACTMWPAKKPEVAYARLKNCLNPEKDEKLDLSEVALLCKVTGRVDPLYWLCDEANYARPVAVSPADKQADLMREFNRRVEELGKIQQQLVGHGVPLQAVR